MQQNLLPPRIARVRGGRLAGGVLPGYDVAGDFIDHADNPDGVWLAVADAVGKETAAGALAAVAIGALRASRRSGEGLEEAVRAMSRRRRELRPAPARVRHGRRRLLAAGDRAPAVGDLGPSPAARAAGRRWPGDAGRRRLAPPGDRGRRRGHGRGPPGAGRPPAAVLGRPGRATRPADGRAARPRHPPRRPAGVRRRDLRAAGAAAAEHGARRVRRAACATTSRCSPWTSTGRPDRRGPGGRAAGASVVPHRLRAAYFRPSARAIIVNSSVSSITPTTFAACGPSAAMRTSEPVCCCDAFGPGATVA